MHITECELLLIDNMLSDLACDIHSGKPVDSGPNGRRIIHDLAAFLSTLTRYDHSKNYAIDIPDCLFAAHIIRAIISGTAHFQNCRPPCDDLACAVCHAPSLPFGVAHLVSHTTQLCELMPLDMHSENINDIYASGECLRDRGDICIISSDIGFCSPYHHSDLPSILAGQASGVTYALLIPTASDQFIALVISPIA